MLQSCQVAKSLECGFVEEYSMDPDYMHGCNYRWKRTMVLVKSAFDSQKIIMLFTVSRNYSASGKQPNRYETFCSFTVDKLELFNGAHADAACRWLQNAHPPPPPQQSYGLYSYHTPYNSFYVVLDAFGYKSKSQAALLFERSEHHLVQHQVCSVYGIFTWYWSFRHANISILEFLS